MRSISVPLLLLLVPIGSAIADCSRRTNVGTEFYESDLVFVGEVTSNKKVLSKNPADDVELLGRVYHLAVSEQFRGMPKAEVLIYIANDSGRFEMKIGQSLLLFARFNPDSLVGPSFWIYNCGYSGLVKQSPKTLAMVRKLSQEGPSPDSNAKSRKRAAR